MNQTWLPWSEACFRLAEALVDCLDQERDHLVQLRIEEVVETTLRKEAIGRELSQARALWKASCAASDPEDEEEALKRKDAEARWASEWQRLHIACESNQGFLKYSLRGINRIADHMKQLLGESPLYTAKGTRTEGVNSGKVLEGRF